MRRAGGGKEGPNPDNILNRGVNKELSPPKIELLVELPGS